jgi:hypothetical protein
VPSAPSGGPKEARARQRHRRNPTTPRRPTHNSLCRRPLYPGP